MKRFVSFFLSLCMVLSLMLLSPVLPGTAVSAEDGNDVSDRLDKLPDDPFSGGYTEYEGKDGSRTLVYDNGGVMTKNPDGSSSGVDFLGNQYQIASDESKSSTERVRANKEVVKYSKMQKELDEYEKHVLYPLSTERIEIDLDDGVKVNYKKFGVALRKVAALEGKGE